MSEVELTAEQKYLLRRVELQAHHLSRDELVHALCNAWEERFRLKQTFLTISREAGFVFSLVERHPWQPPETDEEFKEVMGFVPTEEEAESFVRDLYETATMELDMDDIVLSEDDETRF
jgi:hypothetical protein